jgi:hypothetical protein
MGKIELDHTGAGSGITLSSDGTDLLLDGTAIGGGGAALELYAENPSSPTAPSATGTNAVAIGSNTTATNIGTTAIGQGADATADFAMAVGTSSSAAGANSLAIGRGATANGSLSTAIGTSNAGGVSGGSVANAAGSTAIGGSYANGTDSLAAAIANNTSSYGATGANSVAIGQQAKATAFSGFAFGYQNQSTANYAVTVGRNNVGSSQYSLAIGYEATTRATPSIAFAAGSFSGIAGQHQSSMFALRARTTDATPRVLNSDGGTGGSTNDQIILPNNAAFAFHGTIVARQQASAGTACAAWKIEGLIRREGSAGTTVLVNSATTVLDNTPAWGMALSADTTNGGLKIEVTGAAATNIAWNGNIHTSEVTY